jgi:hypothetical protein
VKLEVRTTYVEQRPAGPLRVEIRVNGKEAASRSSLTVEKAPGRVREAHVSA